MRSYFDSCIAIYLVEERDMYCEVIEQKLLDLPPHEICVSNLVEMECLIIPFRLEDEVLVEKFNSWFASVETLGITAAVFRKAARLRANFPSLKTPDALHLATAQYHNCDELWTNDGRLDKVAPQMVRNIIGSNN